jgi:hypothetical protein
MVLKSFAETLKAAEPDVGIPLMSDGFARWDRDIQQDAESVWPTDEAVRRFVHGFADRAEALPRVTRPLY